MELSPQQAEAMRAVKAWVKTDKQVFRLFGYAGTGKTSIAKEFANTVGGQVLYAAFTGKATMVLQQKGCYPATTIHKLIYRPSDKCVERLEDLELELMQAEQADPVDQAFVDNLKDEVLAESDRIKNPNFKTNPDSDLKTASLLIIDEVSMVGKEMAMDLLSYDTKILVLGDPAQLPPVGCAGFFTSKKADFLLTEIHRQAAGSPVLAIADLARKGQTIPVGESGGSRVVPTGKLGIAEVAEFDQIIVGTNRARKDINRLVRQHLERKTHLPEEGDKLVALRNNYERGILNGSQWEVLRVEPVDEDRIWMQIKGDGFTQIVTAWTHHFEGREREIRPWDMKLYEHFDFGYAVTCHKAQGSQWDNILVIDESRVFRSDSRKWLYTAVTRAAKSVTIVKK